MPLSIRQFDLGINEEIDSWMRQVYDLLISNRELAYSSKELRQELLADSVGTSEMDGFGVGLDVLTGLGALEKRWVNDLEYYAILQEFDTGTWMSAKHSKA